MGTSRPYVISDICSKIIEVQPKTILDIGIGFGKYGFLAKEYTDIWKDKKEVHITGIDAYESTINNPVAKLIYDKLIHGEINKLIKVLPAYDMVFFCDVIEHLTKENGIEVLEYLRKCKHVFVSTPKEPGNRSTTFGNKYEAHISKWTHEELLKYGSVKLYNNHTLLLYMKN